MTERMRDFDLRIGEQIGVRGHSPLQVETMMSSGEDGQIQGCGLVGPKLFVPHFAPSRLEYLISFCHHPYPCPGFLYN